MPSIDHELIQEFLQVAKRLDEKNLVNAYEGNISVRKNGLTYISPTGKNKALLTPDMVAVIDSGGNQISGSCKPTSELPMHMQTYTIRSNIQAVVHAHPPYMTAYALNNQSVETRAYPEMMGNFTRFHCAPYGRPGTSKILEGAIPILEKHDIVILGNHGVLTVGTSITDAMNKMEAAEAITKVVFLSQQIGNVYNLPDDECNFFFSLNGQ